MKMTTSKLLLALSCAALAGTINAASSPAGNASAGKDKAAACGGCHGADGNNPPELYAAMKAPKLAGQLPEYIAKSVHDFKSGKRVNEMMTPQAQNVAEPDIADIAAWFASQKAAKGTSANKELLAAGEKIFLKGKAHPSFVAACVGCHGPNGGGNTDWNKTMTKVPTVLAPAIGGQHAGYIAAQLAAYKTGKRATDTGAVMRNFAKQMSEKDIEAVAEYISTLGR